MTIFLIFPVIASGMWISSLIIFVCGIVYVICYLMFNVLKVGQKLTILKMGYILPVIVGGVIVYLSKKNGLIAEN